MPKILSYGPPWGPTKGTWFNAENLKLFNINEQLMQYLELDQVLPMIPSDLIYSFYLEIYSLIRNSSCYLQYMVKLIYKPITFCQFVKLIKLMSVFLFLF